MPLFSGILKWGPVFLISLYLSRKKLCATKSNVTNYASNYMIAKLNNISARVVVKKPDPKKLTQFFLKIPLKKKQ